MRANIEELILSYQDIEQLTKNYSESGDWSDRQTRELLGDVDKIVARKMLKNGALSLKKMDELLEWHFFIDNYQRGYKWTSQQVHELLKDIHEYAATPTGSSGSFYCLQPLIVMYHEERDCWELIDGQQRITTIYLILSYLKNSPPYRISYETRPGSSEFLENIIDFNIQTEDQWDSFLERTDEKWDNVDNYHFFKAFQTISEWFQESDSVVKEVWLHTMLNRTQVIWYDVSVENKKNQNPIDIFIRINSGKIPLTNAELIKALFLNHPRLSEPNREEIPQKWDEIEQTLQNDSFWYFIKPNAVNDEMPNRIEFLFNILAKKPEKSDDVFYTFNYYAEAGNIDGEWLCVKRCFLQLQEWYEDYEKYHLIGYLVTRRPERANIIKLLELSKDTGKMEFNTKIKEIIKKGMPKSDELKELRYNENNKKIIDVLLLFNIQTLLQSKSNIRFPFDVFIKETWSIEHIHAQNSRKLSDKAKAEAWYHETKILLQKSALINEIELHSKLEEWYSQKEKKSNDAKNLLSTVQKGIYQILGESDDDEGMHSLDNLALLDKDTNSSLNNSIFPEKRRRIIENDKNGKFIPIATKNVFSKYYSEEISQMDIWSKSDRENYLRAIEVTLAEFIQGV